MDSSPFKPVNEPVVPMLQAGSCIEVLNFKDLVINGEINTIQVLYERIAQEIYHTRKKNYNWGFRVIEPEIIIQAERITLVSKLYEDDSLNDLNSVVFKLFTEFNNIIAATALHMHIPLRGLIWIGNIFNGSLRSRKPAMVPGKEPLILSDLLKVYNFSEIYPEGYSRGLIPPVELPFRFGTELIATCDELKELDSIGIFMSPEYNRYNTADVTILSNMMAETEVNGKKMFACNWKEWMSEYIDCSTDNILAFAESEVANADSPHRSKWKSLIEYTAGL